MRFGFTPLYLDAGDVTAAVDVLDDVLSNELWRDEKYHAKARVT